MSYNESLKELQMHTTIEDILQSKFVKSINGNVMIAFNGVMSQETIVGLGDVLRSELHYLHPLSIVNKVFAIFIEMSQNVLHYSSFRSDFNGKTIGKGAILILSSEVGYSLITANLVNEKQKNNIQEKLLMINSLNEDQIKEHYLNRRRRLVEGDSKGAGLGFYDMIRRSGTPVDFNFESLPDSTYVFYLGSNFLLNK